MQFADVPSLQVSLKGNGLPPAISLWGEEGWGLLDISQAHQEHEPPQLPESQDFFDCLPWLCQAQQQNTTY